MALTRSDKEDIQQMHDMTINHIKEILTLTTNNIKSDLSAIKEQTTKTNGRVTILEQTLPHTLENCPMGSRMDALWTDRIANKSIKKWQIAALTIGGAIVGSIVSIIAVFEFILKYKP
jgi:hypothetical protein